MHKILFKTIALAVIGASAPMAATATYDINHHQIGVQNKKAVGFVNNNPIYNRQQHDSQGADTVTLASVNAYGFILNYQLSAATLAYFYPAVGRLVQPADRLFNLLTKGTDWLPTTHYWQPLKSNDVIPSFIGPELYDNYLSQFQTVLGEDFYFNANSQTPSASMSVLQLAMQAGAGLKLTVQVNVQGNNVSQVTIIPSVVQSNYPPAAPHGVDAVWGNMNEPNNVLKIDISAQSCQVINKYYYISSADLVLYLLGQKQPSFSHSRQLNQYINNSDNTKGFKYDATSHKVVNYWNTANYLSFLDVIKQNHFKIINTISNNTTTKGVTLYFSRNQAGTISVQVAPQLPAYRTHYYNVAKVLSYLDYQCAYLTVKEEMEFRLAACRYLAPDAKPTQQAYNNALAWLFNTGSPWADADLVHPYSVGSQLTHQQSWDRAIQKWSWKDMDQFMAEAIIQNRGVVVELNVVRIPGYAYVTINGQPPVPASH